MKVIGWCARGTMCAVIAVLCGHGMVSLEAAAPVAKKAVSAPKQAPKPPEVEVAKRPIKIAKVKTELRDSMLKSAARIDKLVEANYAKYKVTPNAITSDDQFLRRVYLDVTGVIPTYKEARLFLDSRDPEKRSKLIDNLLNSDGYSSHHYNYWANVLRLSERLANNVPGRPYNEWVKESLEHNKPWDEMVTEMLTASGKVWDNPASGYILRDSGMPLDAMNNTVRVFLGTQIGCAQCHNHPFDRWTQREFYEMAAFTFGTTTRRNAADKSMFGGKNVINRLREELKTVDTKFDGGGKYNRFLIGNLIDVHDNGNKLKLPHDYAYKDGKPFEQVSAKTIFEPITSPRPGESPRATFARWMTSPQNPRFAKTLANRLWKKSFGVGQIEPVDDMKDDSVAENPELLTFLESEVKRLKFDMKEYLRVVLNTKTYQRQASDKEFNAAEPYHFPGPILRRMSPEQVWDSFVTMAVYEPESYQIEPAKVQGQILDIDLAKITAAELYELDKKLNDATGGKYRDARDKNYRYKPKYLDNAPTLLLVRASELPTPTPPGHFLRQFGQSDREAIDASSTDGSVPQVLQMFNGPITHMLLEKDSLMVRNVAAQKSTNERITCIFLSILSRRPSIAERDIAANEIKEADAAGYGNVVWALVNTREFLFIQ